MYRILAGFIVLGVAAFAAQPFETDAYQHLASCFSSYDKDTECARADIVRLLAEEGTARVQERVENDFSPVQCHFLGHIIGQETYKESGSVEGSLAACSASCYYSCSHGVIAQAFYEAIGEDVEHADLALIKSEGDKLCGEREMCHGVGHVLAQSLELTDALHMCDSLANYGEYQSCYRGIFMELADPDSAHRFAEVPAIDTSRPLAPCDVLDQKYQPACFEYIAGWQAAAIGHLSADEQIRSVADTCANAEGLSRRYCFAGFGKMLYTYGRSADARSWCESLSSDATACFFGYASMYAQYADTYDALSLCAVGKEAQRSACYQAVFDTVDAGDAARLTGICGTNDDVCAMTLSSYMQNPHALYIPR